MCQIMCTSIYEAEQMHLMSCGLIACCSNAKINDTVKIRVQDREYQVVLYNLTKEQKVDMANRKNTLKI